MADRFRKVRRAIRKIKKFKMKGKVAQEYLRRARQHAAGARN
jgi:hypothetical protein